MACEDFDALSYLKERYSDLNEPRAKGILDELHKLVPRIAGSKPEWKVLDFGCGPVVQHCISVAPYASEIVFSDISSANHAAVRKWLNCEADAFDWSPHFDYVVKTLEGKGEEEAREREQRIRQISKVALCNALSETPMEKGYEGPYDIILQCGCLEAACADKRIYTRSMRRITTLLKPGGLMINYGVNGDVDYEGVKYPVGGKEYPFIRLTSETVVSAFRECGLEDIQVAILPLSPNSWYSKNIIATGLRFIHGRRNPQS